MTPNNPDKLSFLQWCRVIYWIFLRTWKADVFHMSDEPKAVAYKIARRMKKYEYNRYRRQYEERLRRKTGYVMVLDPYHYSGVENYYQFQNAPVDEFKVGVVYSPVAPCTEDPYTEMVTPTEKLTKTRQVAIYKYRPPQSDLALSFSMMFQNLEKERYDQLRRAEYPLLPDDVFKIDDYLKGNPIDKIVDTELLQEMVDFAEKDCREKETKAQRQKEYNEQVCRENGWYPIPGVNYTMPEDLVKPFSNVWAPKPDGEFLNKNHEMDQRLWYPAMPDECFPPPTQKQWEELSKNLDLDESKRPTVFGTAGEMTLTDDHDIFFEPDRTDRNPGDSEHTGTDAPPVE
jgi:hypothetical protein